MFPCPRYGLTEQQGELHAVWKLTSFCSQPEEYTAPWNTLLELATRFNVTKLIYDVTGNGGGEGGMPVNV